MTDAITCYANILFMILVIKYYLCQGHYTNKITDQLVLAGQPNSVHSHKVCHCNSTLFFFVPVVGGGHKKVSGGPDTARGSPVEHHWSREKNHYKNSQLVKFLGRIKLDVGPHPAPGPPVEQP